MKSLIQIFENYILNTALLNMLKGLNTLSTVPPTNDRQQIVDIKLFFGHVSASQIKQIVLNQISRFQNIFE